MLTPQSPQSTGGRKPALSLKELAAFCRELASLVAARIPLGVGLRSGAFASASGINDAAARLAGHVERGRGLTEALAAESETWPPAMRAVVEAGMSTGRLAEALESTARCAQMQSDARLRIGAALIYPAVLVVTASWLLGLFFNRFVSGIEGIYATGPIAPPAWLAPLSAVARTAWIWCHAVPAVVVIGVLAWRLRGQVGNAGAAVLPFVLRWVPGLRNIEYDFRVAVLSDFLALLTAHGVPLPRAWALAADATGHQPTREAGRYLSETIAAGQPLHSALRTTAAFPALFCGIVESAERQGALSSAFRQLAETYYRRAARQSEWARATLPVFLTATFGVGIVMAYAAVVFLPMLRMFFDLFQESA